MIIRKRFMYGKRSDTYSMIGNMYYANQRRDRIFVVLSNTEKVLKGSFAEYKAVRAAIVQKYPHRYEAYTLLPKDIVFDEECYVLINWTPFITGLKKQKKCGMIDIKYLPFFKSLGSGWSERANIISLLGLSL